MYKVELSAWITLIGIILLFSTSILVVLVAPYFVEKAWIEPTSQYQVQMYEISDPATFISALGPMGQTLQYVHHLKQDESLLAFQESEAFKILAPPDLEKYVTRTKDKELKLTTRMLLLRRPSRETLQAHGMKAESFDVYEIFDPQKSEAFSIASPDTILENWVDENYTILEGTSKQPYHASKGVIFVSNPVEYLVIPAELHGVKFFQYDPKGKPVASLAELRAEPLGFMSRKELIELGEHIYAVEGCWYCHTDQTRTLIQDVTLNGGDSYPAPPSSPNEYIYQKITFPGTKRNGPDVSRTGVKKPSRDWHKAHFWSPTSQSAGSIMPSFRHFFDFDPRGTSKSDVGVPNYKFEAIFQYLMTKGTRITPPNQAWWLGKDPIQTIQIIEGQRKVPHG